MDALKFIDRPETGKLAYKRAQGTGPLIVWCGGLKSDMEGRKAKYLHDWAEQNRHNFIRFDYFGHGKSDGEFTQGTISQWANDVIDIIENFSAHNTVILIGSSMGGWAALLAALAKPETVAAMLLINPAPDFTEKLTVAGWSEAQIKALEDVGIVYEPSGYEEPYAYSKTLIEDGRTRQILDNPISLNCAVHILSGENDTVVPLSYAAKLLGVITAEQRHISFTKVMGADHSLSRPEDLKLIETALTKLIAAL